MLFMTVHKQKSSDDKQKPIQHASDKVQGKPSDDSSQQIGTRGGKEQDVIYKQQEKLLHEVQEKYKEADHEYAEQVKEAIGEAVRAKPDVVIPSDVADFGVKSRDQEASEVLKKDGTLEILTTKEKLDEDLKSGVGGKRLINKTIVGAQSVLAWAIRLHRLVKAAHKHAKKVIFKQPGTTNLPVSKEKNAD